MLNNIIEALETILENAAEQYQAAITAACAFIASDEDTAYDALAMMDFAMFDSSLFTYRAQVVVMDPRAKDGWRWSASGR